MSHLIIQVKFIANSYSGVRKVHDRREVLDWPPSPGRLHEALLSGALVGLPRPPEEEAKVWRAFRWVETLAPPVLLVSAQQEDTLDLIGNRRIPRPARSNLRLAIPQNNPNKSKFHEHSTLLAPTLKVVPLTNAPLEVVYQWNIESEAPNDHIEILKDAAARVSYFGRGEDRAEVSLTLADETPSLPLVRWSPNPDGDPDHDPILWTVTDGTTDGLKKRHETPVPPRETKPAAQRWMRPVLYSDNAPHSIQPVAKAIFQLFPDDGNPDADPLSNDAPSGGLWREFFRHVICDFAQERDYWDNPEFAAELLTGHKPDNSPTDHPHLAVVPLPSLNPTCKADGRIRRVALLGYSPQKKEKDAQEIYETIFSALEDFFPKENISLSNNCGLPPFRLVRRDVPHDKIWRYFSGKSRIWVSVTPVAIRRVFNVPKFDTDGKTVLTENERHRKRDAELCGLLRKSLEHVALPAEIAKATRIEITFTPLIPRTMRAEHYRPPGEKSFLTHVRLEFPCFVRGPLLLGDRRYSGLGLFAPVT